MEPLNILGRFPGESSNTATSRASVIPGPKIEVEYTSGALGVAIVQAYFSRYDKDWGGIVLRFTTNDISCSFIPAVKELDNGVELHLAGEAEAASFINALKGVLDLMPKPVRYDEHVYNDEA
jgi:hypothetical protein